MDKEQTSGKAFELCGESFQIQNFPNLYDMYLNNKGWAEEQLKSIADAWHEGDVVSAAQALESDLNKM
jgi:hypothetical protein